MNEMETEALMVQEKLKKLQEYLKELGSVAVAFSGGVDSAFLLKTAHDILGNQAMAITARSCLFPEREFEEARAFCEKEGIRQLICDWKEPEIEEFYNNPPDRCYLCKKDMFEHFRKLAQEQKMVYIAEGSNLDDTGDYRPGLAAVAELDIKSPLRYAGFYKSEIRELSKKMGLLTWNKPSYACLASRFVYGETITKEKLIMVEQAEQLLFEKGFYQVRVRIHDKMARIEVMPEEFGRLVEETMRKEIVAKLKSYGFTYVSMDLSGYRTGSMNEVLIKAQE